MNGFECFLQVLWILCCVTHLCEGFLCGDGNHCNCIPTTGILVCKHVVTASDVDIDKNLNIDYHTIVLDSNMLCSEQEKLRMKTGMKVLSLTQECTNKNVDVKGKKTVRSTDLVNVQNSDGNMNSQNSHENSYNFIFERIYEVVVGVLILISLLATAKVRHNIKPFTDKLSKSYKKNSTFIKHVFKTKVSEIICLEQFSENRSA